MISEAYKRGYKKALQDASSFAFNRKVVCEDAASRYKSEKPNDPYWHQSERCAAREAEYIWEEILKLEPKPRRRGRSS